MVLATALLLALFGAACGGDSGGDSDGPGGGDGPGDGDGDGPGGGGACTSDAQCGAGFFCDRSGTRKDFDCLDDCLFDAMCDLDDDECFFGCMDQCGVTCADGCNLECMGDPGCTAECTADCEAARAGGGDGGGDGTPGDGGGDGTPGDGGGDGTPGDGGGDGTPPPGQSCAEFCGGQCAGIPVPDCVTECVAACEADFSDGDGGGGPGGGGGEGVCRRIPQDIGSDTTDSSDGQTQAPPPADMNWVGTWTFEVTYTANCQWTSSAPQPPSSKNYFVTGQLTGSNADITARFRNGDYEMTGTGNNERLLLSGSFEGRDHRDNTATIVRRDNNLEFRITEIVNANTARGTFSGSYDTSGGISCTVADGGTVEITR